MIPSQQIHLRQSKDSRLASCQFLLFREHKSLIQYPSSLGTTEDPRGSFTCSGRESRTHWGSWTLSLRGCFGVPVLSKSASSVLGFPLLSFRQCFSLFPSLPISFPSHLTSLFFSRLLLLLLIFCGSRYQTATA